MKVDLIALPELAVNIIVDFKFWLTDEGVATNFFLLLATLGLIFFYINEVKNAKIFKILSYVVIVVVFFIFWAKTVEGNLC